MGDWYEIRAERLIEEAEGRTGDSLEEFYRGLACVRDMVNERLEAAREELDPEVANEILG